MLLSIALTIASVIFLVVIDVKLFPPPRHPMPIPADEAHARRIIAQRKHDALERRIAALEQRADALARGIHEH